ncbi:hypothetical protein PPERSA_10269 [Pseudocohnilembus persalinus]|uniref:Uncharacterized protein n=1 Tax=Pseudocohnilembus persalinus TaxID=266149 RepID=A0A0V0R022_PSEPJ|nr:hypothetical protein PPERSA_10269 [Pseudocohnilembus persalinus]|eukprot:KRX07881.1 hypothetical protein PPERSA_10269 [Pseudocohnilembus persalinus]
MKACNSTEWLLFHLWKENPKTGKSCIGLLISEVVIYQMGKPQVWYFQGKDGQIKRQTKEKILLGNIEKVFSQNRYLEKMQKNSNLKNQKKQVKLQQNDNQEQQNLEQNIYKNQQRKWDKKKLIPNISALKLTLKEEVSINPVPQLSENDKEIFSQQEIIDFEYVENQKLKNVIYNNNFPNNKTIFSKLEGNNIVQYQIEDAMDMLLIKFSYPQNGKNQLYKVNWSPQFRIISKRENINDISDTSLPMSERLSTFEGPEYLMNQNQTVSPTIINDIDALCHNINQHIMDITGYNMQIQQMVLYFKLDYKNKLVFQFCTSLKLKSMARQQQKCQKYKLLSPKMRTTQMIKQVQAIKGQVQIEKGFTQQFCSNCEKYYPELFDLQFLNIVESYKKQLIDNQKTVLPKETQQFKEDKKQFLESSTKGLDLETLLYKRKVFKNKEEEHSENRKFLEREQNFRLYDFNKIPNIIQKVWGPMSFQKFEKLSENFTWLQQKTKVCDDCYLDYTRYAVESDIERKVLKQQAQLKETANINKQEKRLNLILQRQQEYEEQKKMEETNQKKEKNYQNLNGSIVHNSSFIQNIESNNNKFKVNSRIQRDKNNQTDASYQNNSQINTSSSKQITDQQNLSVTAQQFKYEQVPKFQNQGRILTQSQTNKNLQNRLLNTEQKLEKSKDTQQQYNQSFKTKKVYQDYSLLKSPEFLPSLQNLKKNIQIRQKKGQQQQRVKNQQKMINNDSSLYKNQNSNDLQGYSIVSTDINSLLSSKQQQNLNQNQSIDHQRQNTDLKQQISQIKLYAKQYNIDLNNF